MTIYEIKNTTDGKILLTCGGRDLEFEPAEVKKFDDTIPEDKAFLSVARMVIKHMSGDLELVEAQQIEDKGVEEE